MTSKPRLRPLPQADVSLKHHGPGIHKLMCLEMGPLGGSGVQARSWGAQVGTSGFRRRGEVHVDSWPHLLWGLAPGNDVVQEGAGTGAWTPDPKAEQICQP